MRRDSRVWWSCLFVIGVIACAPPEPKSAPPPAAAPAPTSAKPAEPEDSGPIDPGFVGEIAPKPLKTPVHGEVALSRRMGGFRVLSIRLPKDLVTGARAELGLEQRKWEPARFDLHVDAPAARVAFALPFDSDAAAAGRSAKRAPIPEHRLWLLVEEPRVLELEVAVYFEAEEHVPVRTSVALGAIPPASGAGEADWGRALVRLWEREAAPDPFAAFAVERLAARFGATPRGRRPGAGRPQPVDASDLAMWMSLATGYASIEAALAGDRRDIARVTGKRSVRLSSLDRPALRRHDWARMLQQLGRVAQPPPIAEAVPKDFYLIHATGGEALFAALDEMDRWGTSAVRYVESSAARYGLAERYQTQLGIERGPLTRLLGPSVIEELAWVGSDPFLRSGSDVTLIFRPKQAVALNAGLQASLGKVEERVGPAVSNPMTLAGVTVLHSTSANGRLNRYLVESNGLVLVSNSPHALERVLLTLQKKGPSLAAEPDFQYMIARDAEREADVLIYLGDAFIERNVGPEARILDARRGLAWSELRRVGYGELLGGYLGGPPRATGKQLVAAGALGREDLKHFDGSPIACDGKTAPSSVWGTARQLTPLIDLPVPAKVTDTEAAAYRLFASQYASVWSDAMDPIALRLSVRPSEERVEAHLRVLPVARLREYREITEVAGAARVDPGAESMGVRALVALDPEIVRRELGGLSRSFMGQRLALDWIGGYAYLGVVDDRALAEALRPELAPAPPGASRRSSDDELIANLPLFAALAVKNRTAARLALTVLKAKFVAKDRELRIESAGTHQGASIERLVIEERGDHPLSVYFTIGKQALYAANHERTLRTLLDREAAGQEPRALDRDSADGSGAQFHFDLNARLEGGLYTALAWAHEYDHEHSYGAGRGALQAEDVLRLWGRRDRETLAALFGEYFGEEPVTVDGAAFEWTATGLTDPARGSAFHPKWPRLPVPGSDFARLLNALAAVEASVGFETEAPGDREAQRSLSVGVRFTTR